MSWERHKVARAEFIPQMGGLHVTGWDAIRECGCRASIGLRMDKGENTFQIVPCSAHEEECGRVLLILQTMPPSDEEIIELFQRLLEEQLATVA